jgi:hypothetical protein
VTEVFVLWHSHGADADDHELIGVYSSRERAVAATARLGDAPGFRDAPAVRFDNDHDEPGFLVVAYELDEDHWVNGHVSSDGFRLERG